MTGRSVPRVFVASLVALGLFVAPHNVGADGVGDAQAKVEKTLADLESMRNQLGQLDEDYGAALDRQDALAIEIGEAQAKVDSMSAQLGGVEALLDDIALRRLTSSGNGGLSPIFSTAKAFTDASQKAALGTMALDTGATNVDDLQSLLADLNDARDVVARKQQESKDLVALLAQKKAKFADLEKVYLAKYEQAKVDLGAARLQAEEDKRQADAAAAAAARSAAAAAARSTTVAAPRGGGGNTAAATTGGATTPTAPAAVVDTPKPTAPPVSGKAGVAVAAAYSQLGVPYRFAAESPGNAFDCSGLTKWAWGQAGVSLPHQSGAQYGSVAHISQADVQPGDLIFYYSPIGHVAMYIGNGQLIHAPATGDVVKIAQVNWGKVVGVGRPG